MKPEIQKDIKCKITRIDQGNDPSFFRFEQEAAEINDDRDDGADKAVGPAVPADEVSRYCRINAYLQKYTDIYGHDMSEFAQHRTKQIDYDTDRIQIYQRHYTRYQHYEQKGCMDQAHNNNRKQETVMHQKM